MNTALIRAASRGAGRAATRVAAAGASDCLGARFKWPAVPVVLVLSAVEQFGFEIATRMEAFEP